MDVYGTKAPSLPQKIVVNIGELFLLLVSYVVLFTSVATNLIPWDYDTAPAYPARRILIFLFSVVVFFRMCFMMFFLLKRKLGWQEVFTVLLAYAIYYVGFSLLVLPVDKSLDFIDYFGIALFLAGSFINSYSEIRRHIWKQDPRNKGKLYTEGLFRYSMHINFFGDLLWVTAFAIITHNPYSALIPLLLFCVFVFYNIPPLDTYLAQKYGKSFNEYASRTSRFIPFIY